MNFADIEYLNNGTRNQIAVHRLIERHQIWEILKDHNPILVGTFPINIDTPTSDVDIICRSENVDDFIRLLDRSFGRKRDFVVKKKELRKQLSVVCRFILDNYTIEIVGQDIEPMEQIAYQHMIIEYKILKKMGDGFRQDVIRLKMQGHKTEPAFAKLLGIEGDAYIELLNYRI